MRHPMTFGAVIGATFGAILGILDVPWSLAVAAVLLPLTFLFDRRAKTKGKI